MKSNARIYVMKDKAGLLKLGHSCNPEKRAKQIGRVVIAHLTDVVEQAERIERLAHRVLALHGKHVRGEWFEATIEDAILAIEIATKQVEQELPLGGDLLHWTKKADERIAIGMKLPPDLVERLDRVRETFPAPAQRTSCIETAIREWLDRVEPQKKGGRK